jgi:signal transduction histidine kinase
MSRVTRVVNDLCLLSKSGSGAAAVHPRRFSLDEMVLETAKAARILASAKGLAVTVGSMPECPFDGYEDLIRQLLLLLLDNAIKYTPGGGKVHVELHRAEGRYDITVSDTGMGIPAEAQLLIFDRFFRVDQARSRSANSDTGGAGLGLSIGKWIAEAHGGLLTLVSSGPDGTTFAIQLPIK